MTRAEAHAKIVQYAAKHPELTLKEIAGNLTISTFTLATILKAAGVPPRKKSVTAIDFAALGE